MNQQVETNDGILGVDNTMVSRFLLDIAWWDKHHKNLLLVEHESIKQESGNMPVRLLSTLVIRLVIVLRYVEYLMSTDFAEPNRCMQRQKWRAVFH